MKSSLMISLSLGTALLLALPAAAQSKAPAQAPAASQQMPMGPGYGRMGRGMGPGMMGGRQMGRGRCHAMVGMMGMGGRHGGMAMMRYPDGTLAFLKAELKIKDSQAKPWNAFAQAMRSNAEAAGKMRAQHHATGRPDGLKAWLKRRETRAAMHLERLRSMSGALIPLYDSLDASQKQTADTLFMPCGRKGWAPPPRDEGDSDE